MDLPSLLHTLIESSDSESFSSALEFSQASPPLPPEALNDLLWQACASESSKPLAKICEILISKGADPASKNQKSARKQTLLHVAVTKRSPAVLLTLLKAKAPVNALDAAGLCPLHYAAAQNFLANTKLLIDHGAWVNPPKGAANYTTPLHLAAQEGHVEIMKLLVAAGAKINFPDSQGRVPLHFAARNRRRDCVQFLLANKADVTPKTRAGLSSLHLASECGFAEIVAELLKAGADLEDKVTSNERTPLHLCSAAGHDRCLALMIERNANLDAQDSCGDTPLHLAARFGRAENVRLLKDAGADLEIPNAHDVLPVHDAVYGGHINCVKFLLDAAVEENDGSGEENEEDVDIASFTMENGEVEKASFSKFVRVEDANGLTPLHIAAHRGRLDIVRCLFQHGNLGGMVSLKDRCGATPLHMAAAAGHLDIIEELILNGSSGSEQDEAGLTPLQWAQKEGMKDAVGLLLKLQPIAEKLDQKRERNRQKREKQRRKRQVPAPAVAGDEEEGDVVASVSDQLDSATLRVSEEGGVIGKIRFNKNIKLGFGSHGTIVFSGFFETRKAAIKRMLKELMPVAQKEIQFLVETLEDFSHPNILRYYGFEEDDDYIYLATEKCEHTLSQMIENPIYVSHPRLSNVTQKMPAPQTQSPDYFTLAYRFMRELASGVQLLHSLNVVHNDLKPENVLISANGSVKISDMGLAKRLESSEQSFSFSSEKPVGADGYAAPETLSDSLGGKTSKVDIHSLGCLFYYILTRGKHPFAGDIQQETPVNVIRGRYNLSGLSDHFFEARHLIEVMIQGDPQSRPTIDAVLAHPFFATSGEKVRQLEELSELLSPKTQERLENHFARRLGGAGDPAAGWMSKLDADMLSDLQSHRSYKPTAFDLIRTIRNIVQHFKKRPDPFLRCLHDPELDASFEAWKAHCFDDAEARAGAIIRYFLHPKRFPWLAIEISAFRTLSRE